jgi:hypothetical protein
VTEIGIALFRKLAFGTMLFAAFWLFDRFYLRGFSTREVIRDHPIAIAVLLGLFAIAVSLS